MSAVTVENNASIDNLQDQIIALRTTKDNALTGKVPSEIPGYGTSPVEKKSEPRLYVFKKGDQSFEIDEEAELEFMADKKPIKLTLRDLKDRAAGDVAVKNRMNSLAEERKRVNASFQEFAKIAETDPLAALEYISNKAKEADSSFEYQTYLTKLADQAEKLGAMDEAERKNFELERKLEKANQDLSQREREEAVALRKQEILSEFPEIGDQKFGEMVDAVLQEPALIDECEDENDVLDQVHLLIEETMAQRDIISAIKKIDSRYASDNTLIFAISNQLKQNPDLDEDDLEDIVRDVLGDKRAPSVEEPRGWEDERRVLSEKQRSAMPRQKLSQQGSSDFHLLSEALKTKKDEDQKFKQQRNIRRL